MMRRTRLLLAVVGLLGLATVQATSPAPVFVFGRLFPSLPFYEAPDDVTLAALTAAGTTANPGPLFDLNLDADDNPNQVPSFFTYFGQFVDHDLTLDLLPLPTAFVDPQTIVNNRQPMLDLDSVFGTAATSAPLYASDGLHLRVNDRDLPRNTDGSAILVEHRNDENQIIAQIHVIFLRAYNHLVDTLLAAGVPGASAAANARLTLTDQYQWIVVHEFLRELLDPAVYADVFPNVGSINTEVIRLRYYLPLGTTAPPAFTSSTVTKSPKPPVPTPTPPPPAVRTDMPVEFSVAAYRMGHSIVRKAYVIAQGGPKIQVFNGTANDLHGGRVITPDHTIFWPNFLNVDGVTPTTNALGQTPTNVSRKIDTLLSSGLFALPIPGAEPEGPSILALRNLQRARAYGVPSGQSVAAHLGLPVLSNQMIAAAIPRLNIILDPAFKGEAPLWLYILAESQMLNHGTRVGPVGSRIIAEVMGGMLLYDQASYINTGWKPRSYVYAAQDLLTEAGVLP